MLDTISLLIKSPQLYQTWISFKTGPFHPKVFRVYPSLVCAVSIIDIALGLKSILNHSEDNKPFIIVMIFSSWDRPHLLSNYSIIMKLISLPLLFSSAAIVLNLCSQMTLLSTQLLSKNQISLANVCLISNEIIVDSYIYKRYYFVTIIRKFKNSLLRHNCNRKRQHCRCNSRNIVLCDTFTT